MSAYYNEFDKEKAAWLRELINAGLVAPGDVDERGIEDVQASDLVGYVQCHFFAGIGIWSYALRLAGWPDERPVWTGSCPCPSFSAAGKGAGFDDPRHLWPHWARLIRECKPPAIFGEQVDDAIGFGWLDLVQTDLEAQAYAVGKAVLGACSVGAPHIRQRLYFVAESQSRRLQQFADSGGSGARVFDKAPKQGERLQSVGRHGAGAVCLEHSLQPGLEGLAGYGDNRDESRREQFDGLQPQNIGAMRFGDERRPHHSRSELERPGPVNGFWRDADWIFCRDGLWRPVEPGTLPLVTGASARVVRLRGYGDGITAYTAKAFIESAMEMEES